MSAEIPFQIETEQSIHNNGYNRFNDKKRKNLEPSHNSNKKTKMSSSIDLEKFEELNDEYEKIYNDFLKKIEKLEKNEEELLNIIKEKDKIIEDREEKLDDFNNRLFYYSDFFGKSFDIAEERYQQEKLFSSYCEVSNDFTNKNIYIDTKTPLPSIFGNSEENYNYSEESDNEDEGDSDISYDYWGEGREEYYD